MMVAKIVVSGRVASAKSITYLWRFMKDVVYKIRDWIIFTIDFFYPAFSKVMDKQTFRYAACGGANTLFDITIFTITNNYILHQKVVYFGSLAISSYIASFMFTFPITFLTGFLLMRYVVFPEAATTRKRVQMTKYLSVVFGCILLNYGFLKLFVEVVGWWPLPAKIATTFFVVMFSYFSQKKFAFRVN
ncbi:MAG TPA: GtrA family protein [Chitinophagaceae bacterium]|nr:GtrA family protein [Chitinophagaceae bacterium]